MCKHFNMLTSVFLLSSLVAANGHMSVRIANGENQKVFTPFYVQVMHNSYVDYDGKLHETMPVLSPFLACPGVPPVFLSVIGLIGGKQPSLFSITIRKTRSCYFSPYGTLQRTPPPRPIKEELNS